MNINHVLGDFVKFTRGTPASYEALPVKNANTLYFIAEPNAKSGKLYLGNKLIAGSINGATSLSELQDVVIEAGLDPYSILVYNGTTWVAKPLAEVIVDFNIPIMQGASAMAPGHSGLVPTPAAGDQDKFLKGDGSWSYMTWDTFSNN